MKYYDFKKAKKLILKERREDKSFISASLGMSGDWSSTAETVYENGKFTKNLLDPDLTIGGIDSSLWAVPSLEFEYSDGKSKTLPCYHVGEPSNKKSFRDKKRKS